MTRPYRIFDRRGYASGEKRAPLPESRFTDRSPCFWCGVRADIGCRHRRASA